MCDPEDTFVGPTDDEVRMEIEQQKADFCPCGNEAYAFFDGRPWCLPCLNRRLNMRRYLPGRGDI